MKSVLILGAGRSSANLIQYLLDKSVEDGFAVRVGDLELQMAQSKIGSHAQASAFALNADDSSVRDAEIAKADLVISMLPAFMHPEVAKACLHFGKNLITPSYVSDEMLALDGEAKSKGLLFLNEMGVDPGIDHMSAMQIIHHLQSEGYSIESFESFTGGLIAPESDNNPWHYKITWNPRNVVLAGYGGTARFEQDGAMKFIPYHKLFERLTEIEVEPYGKFDGYANRDSLKYKKIYGLDNIPTLYRGTLRKSGFCQAWNALVQLGITDDSFQITEPASMTWRQLTASFLNVPASANVEEAMAVYTQADSSSMSRLTWLGIFDEKPLGISSGSPAVALQKLIEEKWVLGADDKDMIVMWHRFIAQKGSEKKEVQSSLIVIGDDPVYTAMSKTVGLPIAMAARRVLKNEFNLTGVHLPIIPELYEPLLEELKEYGVHFQEKERTL
jgi:saccharopine dehydrogenase-like NADP-dependent oxidoreductase